MEAEVQIPLWTIVTSGTGIRRPKTDRSVPMDDCNADRHGPGKFSRFVQIPLWTIVTTRRPQIDSAVLEFRFLYGRL